MFSVKPWSAMALLALGGVALAEEGKPVRQISVSGTVEARVAPDRATWSVSLRDTDKNLQEARRRNDERVKAVLALRDKLQLAEGDLETGQLGVHREYERGPHGEQGAFKHFAVYRSVTIRQRDLKRFELFLNTLLASTDMEVSFQLESSRLQEVRAQTRLKALKVAREKAKAMAEALDVALGPVIRIEEHIPQSPWRSFTSNAAFVESTPAADLSSETFVPGALTLTVTVNVAFELR